MDISLTTPDGKPVSYISKLIELRSKELNQTTKQAAVAVCLNILRSLRARTNAAKFKKDEITVSKIDRLTVSWESKHGSKDPVAVIRDKAGTAVKLDKKVVFVGNYIRGVESYIYKVVYKYGTANYYIVAHTLSEARKTAEERKKKYIGHYKGLAKNTLSVAMAKVYSRGNANTDSKTSQECKQAASKLASVAISEADNQFDIFIHDTIDYATLALRDGEASVKNAINAALIKMIGEIKHKTKDKTLRDSLTATIEELRRKTEV